MVRSVVRNGHIDVFLSDGGLAPLRNHGAANDALKGERFNVDVGGHHGGGEDGGEVQPVRRSGLVHHGKLDLVVAVLVLVVA